MRILLIEDTRAGVTITTAMLARYGEVRAARSIAEAEEVMASGWNPEVIVSDLNLGDGRQWHESFADVVHLARGRPIAAHSADVWHELRIDFARRFSGSRAQLFSKSGSGARDLQQWLQQWRHDESGAMVQTMDRGSTQSGADIRAAIIGYAEELGVPPPAHDWLREITRCIVGWKRRWDETRERVWMTMVTIFAASAIGWLGWAVVQWVRLQSGAD